MSNRRKLRRSTVQRLTEAAQDLDADFFEQHPNIQRYVRPATADELRALGSNLPGDVDLGSYGNGPGLTIGDTIVRRQRLQTNVSNMARTVLRTHITRGNIDLERPGD